MVGSIRQKKAYSRVLCLENLVADGHLFVRTYVYDSVCDVYGGDTLVICMFVRVRNVIYEETDEQLEEEGRKHANRQREQGDGGISGKWP